MKCPSCGHLEDKVVDSRPAKDGLSIRRRRECLDCGHRFTSYEHIEESFPTLVKKDGSREEYDRQKLRRGIKIACNKLPIPTAEIDKLMQRIERRLLEVQAREVQADFVGTSVMEELRDLDPVAYIRFASVYRKFDGIEEFLRELKQLSKDQDA